MTSRGRTWFDALAKGAARLETNLGSLIVADGDLSGERVRLLAIVPDPNNRFPRARRGEVGLDEGWALARHVREAMAQDAAGTKRPILAVIDSRSQAYGRTEELLGIHLSLAAAADAYASARLAGHPVVGLIVGEAISGALLAHGMQANRLLAFDAPGVVVHAMHEEAAARVTRRTTKELDDLGKTIIPMSYDIHQYAKLGLLHELIAGIDADAPSPEDIDHVAGRVIAAISDIRKKPGDLTSRLDNEQARASRRASLEVRRRMLAQWNAR